MALNHALNTDMIIYENDLYFMAQKNVGSVVGSHRDNTTPEIADTVSSINKDGEQKIKPKTFRNKREWQAYMRSE